MATTLHRPIDEDEDTVQLINEIRMFSSLDDYSYDDDDHSTRNNRVDGLQASLSPNAGGNGTVRGLPVYLFPDAGDGPPHGIPESLFYFNGGNNDAGYAIRQQHLDRFLDNYFHGRDDSEDDNESSEEGSASPTVLSPQSPNNQCLSAAEKYINCLTHMVTLWTIVFITMVFGVSQNGSIPIGMGSSLLLKPNRFFVETINVEQPFDNNVEPILFGFKNQPPLSVIHSWSEAHYTSLQANIYKEWIYFLNEGSEFDISYSVPNLSKLLFTINKGSNCYNYRYGDGYCCGFGQCLYDQSGPNTTLSWSIIQGNGRIKQHISQSGKYHIAVENLNSGAKEVQLNISARTSVYDTSDAYHMCKLGQRPCVFTLSFLEENHVVLTTPGLKKGSLTGELYVNLSYGPRWSTFFGGIGMVLAALEFWDKYGP